MKRFLFLILIFIVPIILLLGGAEYCLRQIPNEYSYKSQWLEKNASTVECVILGNSHTYLGVRPSFLSCKSFSLANVSQPLKFDEYILSKYEQNMDSLKYIIVNISYLTFLSGGFIGGMEEWRVKYYSYFDYYDENPLSNIHLLPMNMDMWKRLKSYLFDGENEINCDELGFGTSYSLENKSETWKESGKIAAERHTSDKIDEQKVQMNISYLEKIISIAQKHEAQVILLTTPAHKLYRDNLNTEQLQLRNKICDSLVLVHNNLCWLNYFSDTTFTDDDFYDADHLSDLGAEKLTIKLAQYLDSLQSH